MTRTYALRHRRSPGADARTLLFAVLALAVVMALQIGAARAHDGEVVDGRTGAPIAGATVTLADQIATTDARGHFSIGGADGVLRVRAAGFRRLETTAGQVPARLALEPLHPRALYLTVYGIGSAGLRDPALETIEKAGLNALVVDLKGDRGLIPYPAANPIAAANGALKLRTIPSLAELAGSLKAKGIYSIARIVVFKDDLLATVRPEWAVRSAGGAIWKDREGLAWIDPFRREAWDYVLDVAEEAAAAGLDEIQFDYIRFPDAGNLVFSQPSTEASRVQALTGFLQHARRRLAHHNVFIAVDVFGYVCWNRDDTGIGQRLEDLAAVVDYISPMLYPSSFQFGIPGYRNPVANSYEIVRRSLAEAQARTAGTAVRYRPWLQAFRDYAFGGQVFGAAQIGAQVRAAEDAHTIGWMLWNPRNVYTVDDLREVPRPSP